MPARRTTRLLVTTLTTAALATTGLVTVTAVPAAAEPVEATYTCTFPLLDEVDVTLTLDVPELPEELPVGIPVPDGDWDVEGALDIPGLVVTLLLAAADISGTTEGFGLLFGDATVPVDLASPLGELPLGDDIALPLSGESRRFVPTELGEQLVALPDEFRLGILDELGLGLLDVTCEYWDGDDLVGTVTVVKQTSTINGKVLKKPTKVGRKAKILVSVLNQLDKGATGDVVATLDGKQVGRSALKKGTAKLKLAGLAAGKHRVKLTYLGSETVSKATKTVTVRVVRT